MPVLVFAGDEDFELYRKLKKIKESLLKDAGAFASINLLTIQKPQVADIFDHALSQPMGFGNKVIVFDDCDFFARKKKNEKSEKEDVGAKQLEKLDDYLGSVLPNTYLIFVSTSNFDENLKLSKIVKKHAQIELFPKTKYYVNSKNPKLETWCRKEAKLFDATIDDDAITYLLDGTEANLRQISQEIHKAATYVFPKTHITLDVVTLLSPFQFHIFSLLEYWLEGKHEKVLASIDELLSRQPGIAIIATLHTFLGRWIDMLMIKEDMNAKVPSYGPNSGSIPREKREMPMQEIVKRVSYLTHGNAFMIEKDLTRLRKQNSRGLQAKQKRLLELEERVKIGELQDKDALLLFFAS